MAKGPSRDYTEASMQRPLFLNGFMATGKTTLGRLVALNAGRPFVDLDERVTESAGLSIPEIFAQQGEPGFRALERRELERLLDGWKEQFKVAPVVALGGGALLERAIRVRVLCEGVLVHLSASVEDILSRGNRPGTRPLFPEQDAEARVRSLLSLRSAAYAEAHAHFSTSGQEPGATMQQIVELWQRDPIAVAAGSRSYVVEVGQGIVSSRLAPLCLGHSAALLVTDENVQALHGSRVSEALERAGIRVSRLVLEPGEIQKRLAAAERIWLAAQTAEVDRGGLFVALGGGVVSDVAGFAAACWLRGVSFSVVPTSLLAMVDAAVGGKTGVDLGAAKNAVGAFWQPKRVLADVELSATEPARGFTSALAEVVKTALIGDPELFTLLEQQTPHVLAREPAVIAELVRRSIAVKARIVSLDERESSLRAQLNLGHTLGHALEAHYDYTELTHGEAVSLGLVAALAIGERLGATDRTLRERATHLLSRLGLPTELERHDLVAASALLGHDKKRAANEIRFILAKQLGTIEARLIELGELKQLVAAIRA